MEYSIGDYVKTKKPHPCGGDVWLVVRTGADIKLKCMQCGHVVMLDLEVFKKAILRKVEKGENE